MTSGWAIGWARPRSMRPMSATIGAMTVSAQRWFAAGCRAGFYSSIGAIFNVASRVKTSAGQAYANSFCMEPSPHRLLLPQRAATNYWRGGLPGAGRDAGTQRNFAKRLVVSAQHERNRAAVKWLFSAHFTGRWRLRRRKHAAPGQCAASFRQSLASRPHARHLGQCADARNRLERTGRRTW